MGAWSSCGTYIIESLKFIKDNLPLKCIKDKFIPNLRKLADSWD